MLLLDRQQTIRHLWILESLSFCFCRLALIMRAKRGLGLGQLPEAAEGLILDFVGRGEQC
jgi:hypothetical protein